MIWIDFAIIGIILVSAFISLIRGFVREALSLVGWVVSFWIALTFAGGFAELFLQSIDDKTFRVVVGFGILFVTALILFVIVNYFAVQLVHRTGLSGTDRFIGVVFGILRGTLIIAVLVMLAGLSSMPKETWWKESLLLSQFQGIALWLGQFLPTNIGSSFKY